VLDGFYADTARTVAIGEISAEARHLLAVTERSLYAGLGAARVGGRVGDIGAAVEKIVRAAGFRCVDEYTGHGIGRRLHEDPKVFNTSVERGRRIAAGLTVAVEPMVNIGTSKTVTLEDKWTVVSADGSLSAHFEHTAAVTADGVEVLTMDPADEGMVALAREAGLLWREP
jgi:methionyl aminopeptidase